MLEKSNKEITNNIQQMQQEIATKKETEWKNMIEKNQTQEPLIAQFIQTIMQLGTWQQYFEIALKYFKNKFQIIEIVVYPIENHYKFLVFLLSFINIFRKETKQIQKDNHIRNQVQCHAHLWHADKKSYYPDYQIENKEKPTELVTPISSIHHSLKPFA